MTNSTLNLIGAVNGVLLVPGATNIDGQVVPSIFGRQWVRPVPLLARKETGAYGTNDWSPWSGTSPASLLFGSDTITTDLSDTVDVIWALGQAGLIIRAVKVDGKIVGIRKTSAGSWVTSGDGDVEWALVKAFGSFVSNRVENTSQSPYDLSYSPIEVMTGTGAGGVWGRRITAAPVRSQSWWLDGNSIPRPTWSNITGSSCPAWSHLDGTEAAGIGYVQLTTIRTIGQPRFGGKLPTNIEVLVDSPEGADMSPDAAIRRILVQGLGVPDGKVYTSTGPDGATSSSFAAWCAASPQLRVNAQLAGRPQDLLEDLLNVSAGELVPTADGGVKVLPLGDQPVGGYAPATASYVITDVAGDVVEVEEADLSECPNQVVVKYTDPIKPEVQHQITCRDEDDIRRTGCRPAQDISSEWISTAEHARWYGDWYIRRKLRNRRTLRFEADPRYMAQEQGDLVQVHDPVLGDLVFRVKTKDLDPDSWVLSFEAEEWRGDSVPVPVIPDSPLSELDNDPGIPAINLRVDSVTSDLSATTATASLAYSTASVAYTTANNAQATASNAQQTANQAVQAASAAQGTASAAGIAAQSALSQLPGKAATDFSNVGDGSVSARLLAADIGIVRKLIVSDWENLCGNPSGEPGNAVGWFGAVSYNGSSGFSPGNHEFLQSDRDGYYGVPFAVTPGDQFYVSWDCYQDNDFSLGQFGIGLAFFANQPAADSRIPTAWIAAARALRGGGTQHVSGTVTVPSGYTFAWIWTQIGAPTGATGHAAFRNVQVRRMNAGNLIVDGAITGGKIQGDALQTSNYAQDGNGNPTAGAKLDKDGLALKVAPKNCQIGTLTIEKQLTALLLSDISRPVGSTTNAGYFCAMDDTGGNVLMMGSGSAGASYLLNGNAYQVPSYPPLVAGDAVWYSAGGFFVMANPGAASMHSLTPAGSITKRANFGAQVLVVQGNGGSNLVVSDAVLNTPNLYYSTNGTTWAQNNSPVAATWAGGCWVPGKGFLMVGNDSSNNVVAVLNPNGAGSWLQCSLPYNTGGTVYNPRTGYGGNNPSQGVVCGRVNGRVLILTQNYIWTASTSADLLQSSSWTRTGATWGASPRQARSTDSMLVVSFAGSSYLCATLDGLTWRTILPGGGVGSNSTVLGLAACQAAPRAQVMALVGNVTGAANLVASGIVNETYD
jgi:hypothetical protein